MPECPSNDRESLDERIRVALLEESASLQDLAKRIGVSQAELSPEIERLAREHKISNVAQPEYPIWTWRLGNQATDEEIVKAVIRLLSESPRSIPALVAVIGADEARVLKALSAVRRGPEGKYIANYGTDREPLWAIEPHDSE